MQCIGHALSTSTRGSRRQHSCSARPAHAPAHPRNSGEARIEFPHPLSWWRVRPVHSFSNVDVLIARQFLRKVAIAGEPFWYLGAAGNAAVAMRVAVRIQSQQKPNLVTLDVAMTAVLCIALAGHEPAAVLLASALKRRSDIEPHCVALSDGWLASHSRMQFLSSA